MKKKKKKIIRYEKGRKIILIKWKLEIFFFFSSYGRIPLVGERVKSRERGGYHGEIQSISVRDDESRKVVEKR